MTKEDQINEIWDILSKDAFSWPAIVVQKPKAIAIYESGYRKADEVRKETAREILNLVYQRIKDISVKSEYQLEDESVYEDSSLINTLNFIGKKYGAEVEDERE